MLPLFDSFVQRNADKKIDGEINKFEFKEINATKEIANHLVKLI